MALLLERTTFNLDAKDKEGRTALHFAAEFSGKCVKILLDKGANVNQANPEGLMPLQIAAKYNNGEGIEHILQKGVNVNEKVGENEETALHFAIMNNSYSVLKPLANYKVDLFVLNKDKKTAVSYLFKQKLRDPTSESGSMKNLYDGNPSQIDEQTRSSVLEAFDVIDPREFLSMSTHPSRVLLPT